MLPLLLFCFASSGAGKGNVDVVILDPHGRKDTVRPSIQPVAGKEGTFLVEYIAIEQGLHSVNIFFAGSQIPNSPFGVQVAPRKFFKFLFSYLFEFGWFSLKGF